MFKKNEGKIIANDISEMTITHKLAEYLQQRIPVFNVDVEYNRTWEGDSSKPKCYIKGKKGLPDIIIHERMSNKSNLLIIEIKKQKREKDEIQTKINLKFLLILQME